MSTSYFCVFSSSSSSAYCSQTLLSLPLIPRIPGTVVTNWQYDCNPVGNTAANIDAVQEWQALAAAKVRAREANLSNKLKNESLVARSCDQPIQINYSDRCLLYAER